MLEIQEQFKDRLNKALELRDIKAVELAERVGMPESRISQYRSGYAKPKIDGLVKIANALSVNPAWLLGLKVDMEARNLVKTGDQADERMAQRLSLYEEKIVEAFRNSDSLTKAMVVRMLGLDKE